MLTDHIDFLFLLVCVLFVSATSQRVRPLAPRELAEVTLASPTSTQAGQQLDAMSCQFNEQDVGQLKIENHEKKQTYAFEFERVFTPQSQQAEVFAEIRDLITSVMDGYNTCIFAYGQTGSGKVSLRCFDMNSNEMQLVCICIYIYVYVCCLAMPIFVHPLILILM